jgi:antitoxin component of MazEF toxin-antitoxin module
MLATVTSFGDSLGVQFPKSMLRDLPVFENDNVEILIKNNSIVIQRHENKKHYTTKERINAFSGAYENFQLSEMDWGKPQGKELW